MAFDNIENKHSLYYREDYIKKCCISLRKDAADVINFERMKMLLLTEKELKSHQDATQCYLCRKKFSQKLEKDKSHKKVKGHCHFIK